MKHWVMAGVVALGLGWWFFPTSMPMQSLPLYAEGAQDRSQLVGGPCTRTRCLIVYLAPWCPYCKAAQPMIQQLREAMDGAGVPMQVVVGMDKPAALQAYAQSLGYPVLLDAGGELKKRAHIKSVPTFIVTDGRGRIKKTLHGAYADVATTRDQLGI